MTDIPAVLQSAYQQAHYHYQLANRWHPLRHGDQLADLTLPPGTATAAFVTAMNPRSKLLSATDNNDRQTQLHAWLSQRRQHWLPAYASDPQALWPDEHGVLWLNPVPADVAAALQQFEQNAALACFDGVFRLWVGEQ